MNHGQSLKKLVEQFQAVDVMDVKETFYVFFIFQTIFFIFKRWQSSERQAG